MSDYSFMQTGNNNSIEQQQEHIYNLASIVSIFTEDAIHIAQLYVQHSSRKIIHKEDIQKALKVRAYYGNTFWNLPNVQQRLEECKKFIQSHEESGTDDLQTTDEPENYTLSNCSCEICSKMNEIENIWVTWVPQTTMDIIIKKSITQ